VWKAVREVNMAKVRNLQKLILKSRSARLLAIRQITQLNVGKKTAGVDEVASLDHFERLLLEQNLRTNYGVADFKYELSFRKFLKPKTKLTCG
jgi:retron-type reverse transcriptase